MANNYGGNFPSFSEYLQQNQVRQDRQAYPFYTDNADYNTNSKSYYDDLARKNKLIEILAKRIWEYDEELAKRFEEWDKNLEEFPEDVEKLLIEWLKDGTLDDIINKNIFKDLNTDINSIKAIIIQLKNKDDKQDTEINRVDNRVTTTERNLNNRLDNIVSPSPIDVVDNVTELNSKYPNGADGVVVVKEDGHYYYYQNDNWVQGGEYISPITYPLVEQNGAPTNLNLEDSWKSNPDITALSTGFYTAFLQNKNTNSDYPVAKNIPKEIDGRECLIKVFHYGLNDTDKRTDYEIVENSTSNVYLTSQTATGELLEWGTVLKYRDKYPLQQYKLTNYNGDIQNIEDADPRNDGNNLNIPITEMPTGFYYGQINNNHGSLDRKLPDDILYSNYFTFNIYKNYDNRISITLHDNASKRTWQCYSLPNANELIWKRLDTETDILEYEQNLFTYKANKINNNNFKSFIVADTHAQHRAVTNQLANINVSNIEDFYNIDNALNNNDASVHLGDWIDGNHTKENSVNSMVKLSKEYYTKNNRYGIYGNHDYNPQWNGFSGENGQYKYDLTRIFDKQDMKEYFTPNQKDYYFVDNEDKNIRMIFLNSFDISYFTDDEGYLFQDPLNANSFGSLQVEWLLKTLNSVPQNYNVVIYTHDTFNNVFSDITTYYNGDLVRKICEAYQNKENMEVFTTGIDETSSVYEYYQIEKDYTFKESNGKILGVINGHRHTDKSIIKNGIRYISLLCSRAEGGTTEEKPPRNYYKLSRNALSFLEFDLPNQKINLIRYGAGQDASYKMFE